ncbi:MAG: c-type cytochrome [Gemmatimonadota bacterium]|nr:c-type cytochrome [Gemmatimonadota bacterium]
MPSPEWSFLAARSHAAIALYVVISGAQLHAQNTTLSPFSAAKAQTLLRDRLSCLGCHQYGDAGGRIAPDLSTVGKRRSRDYITRMIRDPQGTVPGTIMPKSPMPEQQVELITRFLAEQGVSESASVQPSDRVEKTRPTASETRLSREPAPLYARNCAPCHGAKGAGDGPNARYLPRPPTAHSDRTAMTQRPDDTLFDAIAAGGYILGKSSRMPAFGQTLSTAEIRGLVRYIRELCRCEGPAWSRDGSR